MTEARTKTATLNIASVLHDFIVNEALPGTGLEAAAFWEGLAKLLTEFAPRNAALMAKRDAIQAQIDAWYKEHKGKALEQTEYQAFLTSIGYLVPVPADVAVTIDRVDDEIAVIAGPQLVVP
ncbi:MAG: malate synthase G, partial [Negativicutes bacterium]|nr:malate synthase G [Negativicutes bacterium]